MYSFRIPNFNHRPNNKPIISGYLLYQRLPRPIQLDENPQASPQSPETLGEAIWMPTVGLVHLSKFRKRRADLAEQRVREAAERLQPIRSSVSGGGGTFLTSLTPLSLPTCHLHYPFHYPCLAQSLLLSPSIGSEGKQMDCSWFSYLGGV